MDNVFKLFTWNRFHYIMFIYQNVKKIGISKISNKRFLSKYMARQHSEDFNLTDCFNHLLFMSDPIIRKEAPVVEEKKHEMKYEDDFIFESFIDRDDDIEEWNS